MMSLSVLPSSRNFRRSMVDLSELDEKLEDIDEPRVKESMGLLRRAFSSRRKKKRNKDHSGYLSPGRRTRSPSPSPTQLSPRGSIGRSSGNELQVPSHRYLRAVRSNPVQTSSYFDR